MIELTAANKGVSYERLPVRVSGVAVGYLESASGRGKHREHLFRYEPAISERLAVSLNMPVRAQPYTYEGIHPIFDMNMPEGHLRMALMNMFRKAVAGFDALQLLRVIGPYQLGRITLGQKRDKPMPGTSIQELLVHDGAQDLFDDLLETYAAYSGVSGVQPKVLVRADSGGDVTRLSHRGATHIVKAWQANQYPELATNEFFCLRAATYAGLDVAKHELSSGGKFLIVERFDVAEGGYLGFEDFCVLSGKVSDEKYDSSYEACARIINAYLPVERRARALQELFVSVALTTAIQNGDAHLKNFGLLYDHTGVDADIRLAPAFDLITTTAYLPKDHMALMLAGSKNWPKHKLLYNFGRISCGLGEAQVAQLLELVADGISKAAAELRQHMREADSFADIGTKMLSAWDKGTMRSLLDDKRRWVSLANV
ncbi:type II toxin-antitoxin system HipA family toxin [Pseudomonas saliphila]|uniref:type II toxin-antitoxin system HipA family toxin n=1 Tax=Pseudomonas saliphila TaxID=2586906 RepID=UPI00123C2E11|nr:type II toxin-antitoxin system HipA family toxin [Pseudomonas saliphila]